MTLEEKDKEALIKYKINRANETIIEAKEALESDHLNLAVNRIYYSCFYSTEALLLTKDLSFSHHPQVIGEFNRIFIHGDLVDKKYYKAIDNFYKNRQTGDYGDFVKFDKDEVRNSLGKAEEFVTEINKMTLKFINKQEIENKQKDNPQHSVNTEPLTSNPESLTQDIKNQPKPTIKFRR